MVTRAVGADGDLKPPHPDISIALQPDTVVTGVSPDISVQLSLILT